MKKHKYLFNFYYFSLWFDAFFGLLDCDYTPFDIYFEWNFSF
jgi:hypothetical protein